MATRRPLTIDGSGNLVEMTDAQIVILRQSCAERYSTNPSVSLSQVSSSGTLAAMADTRLQAGATSTSNTAFVAEGSTAEPSVVTVSYDKISETRASVTDPTDTNNRAYPLYYRNQDGSGATGNLHAMSKTDMIDVFIGPALTTMSSATVDADVPGTYHINTASSGVSGSTIVSGTPIFLDTRADTSAYSAAGIPETADQPTTINSYYLWKVDTTTISISALPCFTDGSGNIEAFTEAEWEALVIDEMRYAAVNNTTYKHTYAIGGSGNTRGSSMVDTRLDGSGNYQTLQVGDDYRSQEFPNGSAATINTYLLKLTLGD